MDEVGEGVGGGRSFVGGLGGRLRDPVTSPVGRSDR